MTTLFMCPSGEVGLTLRGTAGNRILATLRRWPYWIRCEIERDPLNTEKYLAITLITDQLNEKTLREILRRSFGMTFPPEGGSNTEADEA